MVSRKKSDLGRGGKLFYWGMLAVPIICFIMFYIIINFNSIILHLKVAVFLHFLFLFFLILS